MFKTVILAFLAVSTLASANSSVPFLARGVGYFCYQRFDGALANAKTQADTDANRICAPRAAKKLGDWRSVRSNGCRITITAEYVCD